MHIAIATTEFITEKNTGAGLASYTANLARLLRDHGHMISIFILGPEDKEIPFEEDIMVYRIHYETQPAIIKKIKSARFNRYFTVLWNLFAKSWYINRKMKRVDKVRKIDLAHYPHSESLGLFRHKKIPTVIFLACYQPLVRCAYKEDFVYEKCIDSLNLEEWLQIAAIKRVDAVYAPSRNVARLTERKAKREISIIEAPFYFKGSRIDNSIYMQFLSDKKYFMFYGTLNYLKGVHVIASILNQFFENYPDYYFIFVGRSSTVMLQGNGMDAVEYVYAAAPQHRDKIVYYSFINNKEQLYALIKHAKAVVLPSRVDNLPNACIESMALGQIVIGTDGASFEQLIEDGYNGFLIERENSSQLYEKMVQVINMSEQKADLMRTRASKSVERLYPDNIYEQMMAFYQSVKELKQKGKKQICEKLTVAEERMINGKMK